MIIHDVNQNGLGCVEVCSLPLPEGIKARSATYTYSGTVLLTWQGNESNTDPDFQRIAVLNDDGSKFRDIFSGVIKQHPKANGIRYMVFADNKRVLLGDYVLECFPDIDSCENAKLVPVEYPASLMDDPRITNHWSEFIIAPDNEHIAWTILRTDIGAAAVLGILKRLEDRYVIRLV